MERKQMTLAQAEALLLRKGCTFDDHVVPGSMAGKYRVVMVPYDVLFGLKCWSAIDCIRRHMPATYMFEDRKSKKYSS
jgi:hypothetical protein